MHRRECVHELASFHGLTRLNPCLSSILHAASSVVCVVVSTRLAGAWREQLHNETMTYRHLRSVTTSFAMNAYMCMYATQTSVPVLFLRERRSIIISEYVCGLVEWSTLNSARRLSVTRNAVLIIVPSSSSETPAASGELLM